MNATKSYLDIVSHYETCLARHGDSHLGVDWMSAEDAGKRYRVMLDLIDGEEDVSLLDFGCGASHMLTYMQANQIDHIRYAGLDISAKFIQLSRAKYPEVEYLTLDVLDEGVDFPAFDYIVMNGVFTEKGSLSFDDMFDYFRAVIRRVFPKCRRGLAFNVRAKQVIEEESDLFHLPFDRCAWFLSDEISRNYVFRQDYGLEEYTVYAYQQPRANRIPNSVSREEFHA